MAVISMRVYCSLWPGEGRPCLHCGHHKPVKGMTYCACCAHWLGGNTPWSPRARWETGRVRVRGVVSGGLPTLGKHR
jgi:hypothetical protein